MNDMKRLLSYAGPYKRDMIFGAVLVLVETCFELFIPILISNLIDIGIANGDLSYIYRKGIQMGICALFALVTGILYAHFAARATYGWGAEIRKAEYEKMLDEVENAIGHDRLKIFHSHFSKIMFTNPGGEKKHLTFDDNQGFGPDYEPLMEIVAKKDLSPIFVCESAGTQDKDALTMKNYYLSVK